MTTAFNICSIRIFWHDRCFPIYAYKGDFGMAKTARSLSGRWTQIIVYTLAYFINIALILSLFLAKYPPIVDLTIINNIVLILTMVGLSRYFIYLYLSPFYYIWQNTFFIRNRKAIATYRPKVSVIIPAWNEEIGLIPTIKTLLKSTYTNLEIVVINDGSTDNSHELMLKFLDDYELRQIHTPQPIDIVYQFVPNGGKGQALNTGITLSTGEIIMTIDADCLVSPSAVENFVHYFADPTIMAASGNIKIGNRQTLIGTLQYIEYILSFYNKKVQSLFNVIYVIGGAAGAFRREVFDKIGYYHTDNATEDIDLTIRIQEAGMRIVYASDAVVFTEGASNLPGIIRQRTRWRRGRFETFRDHRSLFFSFKRSVNKLLSWVILPETFLGEAQITFYIPSILFFLSVYGVVAHDFSPFLMSILIFTSTFFILMAFGERNKQIGVYALVPIIWLLFYIVTYYEVRALAISTWQYLRKQESQWQRWKREGTFDPNASKTSTGTYITPEV
jgi:biofilm PGA synthesis N-glycosyltransferase PgaC